METRRAAQSLLLRSQSKITSTLLFSISARATTSFTSRALPTFTCHSCRHFSIQPRLRRDDYDPNAPIRGIQAISISAEKESGTSLDDLDTQFEWPKTGIQYPESYKPTFGSKYAAHDLQFPDHVGETADAPRLPLQRVLTELPIRLSARTGRTIEVDPGKNNDLGTKMKQLDMLCARNKIRADFAKQRFHERGGMKRKRLKSERWRLRFKNEFRKTVLRVQELRRKGW